MALQASSAAFTGGSGAVDKLEKGPSEARRAYAQTSLQLAQSATDQGTQSAKEDDQIANQLNQVLNSLAGNGQA
jgi:hypothetical protein